MARWMNNHSKPFAVRCAYYRLQRKKSVMTEQAPLKNYKLTMVQMEVEAGKVDAGLGCVAERIAEATAS